MKRWLISGCLLGLASAAVWAEQDMYLHTHKGTPAQAKNQDTNFGSPADYDRSNNYRGNYELQLSAAGVDAPKKLTLEHRAVANFDVHNNSDKDALLVIGDDKATREIAEMLAAGKSSEALSFHTYPIKAGQTAQLAWNFDTYRTRKVKFSSMDSAGHIAAKVLTVNVGPREDKNAQFAGH